MDTIPEAQVLARISTENPWWSDPPHQVDRVYRDMRPRACIESFAKLVEADDVRRAVVLMGPRRVGKTVLLQHVIQRLLAKGVPPRAVACLSLDQPLYSNLSIEELVARVRKAGGLEPVAPAFLFLDEIQYLRDWERHLKVFVDAHPHVKCVVSGSAAAALRLKSIESGAGRFTDFFLPPLTFYEYLDLQDIPVGGGGDEGNRRDWNDDEVGKLNEHFMRYIRIGGYPEIIFSRTIQQNMARYVRSDIVDKVLLRDLPSLYGIQDIQELNSLFMSLAWNTAQEVSLEGLSQRSGVTKPTLKRYLEYLEAAFLIRIVHRIDHDARRFRRANFFKVYLVNPSIHYALFGPPQEVEPRGVGAAPVPTASPDLFGPSQEAEPSRALVETAVFAQLLHFRNLVFHYARWKGGEVDIVSLDERGQPAWCMEVKWSDRNVRQQSMPGPLLAFLEKHPGMRSCALTTRTRFGRFEVGDREIEYLPASVYSYRVGIVAAPDLSP